MALLPLGWPHHLLLGVADPPGDAHRLAQRSSVDARYQLNDPSGAHLRATRNAGVVGLLFGGGAAGTTSDQTDGGFFYRLARRYEAHPLALTDAFGRQQAGHAAPVE